MFDLHFLFMALETGLTMGAGACLHAGRYVSFGVLMALSVPCSVARNLTYRRRLFPVYVQRRPSAFEIRPRARFLFMGQTVVVRKVDGLTLVAISEANGGVVYTGDFEGFLANAFPAA